MLEARNRDENRVVRADDKGEKGIENGDGKEKWRGRRDGSRVEEFERWEREGRK